MSSAPTTPLQVFRFLVEFQQVSINPSSAAKNVMLCQGAFAECTGLEATTEVKAIKEGGRNYGVAQRAGNTTFATVILKRGIGMADLWTVFNTVATKAFAVRLQVNITVFKADGTGALAWKLDNAIPIKYKFADLNAKGTEIGIEELHLAHEGLGVGTVASSLQGGTHA
ncbi:MAG: phage tail protein [Candidatus Korobacteraceae bacterium]